MELLHDAARCLRTALTEAGAGAKTAAGYGWFQPIETDKQPSLTRSFSRKYDLTLDSPAFLAGAERTLEGCELRSASLRGQVRSWWRTLHAGCLSVDDLRSLEAALWGDTNAGGAIRFSIEPTGNPSIEQYKHPPERESGVRYLAYGMDDGAADSKQVRMVMLPGMTWDLKVRIRGISGNNLTIARERVVEQFEAALGLLGKFGGVGAKSRKGFGSLSVSGGLSSQPVEIWKQQSTELRRELNKDFPFSADHAESAGLFDPQVQIIELKFTANSAFDVLESVGCVYKSISGSNEKITLGLPRKIHGPTNNPMRHQAASSHQPPQWLDFSKRPPRTKLSDARHSAPVHIHVERNSANEYTIRIVLFPMKYLPNRNASIAFLGEFAEAFTREFKLSSSGPRRGFRKTQLPTPRATSAQVEVTNLEVKQISGKSGFKVQEEGKRPGMLVDGDPPTTLPGVGDKVMVYWVATSDANSPRYRWTPPTQSPPRGNKRGDNRR
jgi:CRISPR-associated protein Cmr6